MRLQLLYEPKQRCRVLTKHGGRRWDGKYGGVMAHQNNHSPMKAESGKNQTTKMNANNVKNEIRVKSTRRVKQQVK